MFRKVLAYTTTLIDTATSFSHSIVRVMQVASEDENGDPKRMTQVELADRSGVARSTLAKYSAHGDSGVINPDLATICRIADVLDVPPAFLIMRPQDWADLGEGAIKLAAALNDPKFLSASCHLTTSRCVSASETSSAGLALAAILGAYGREAGISTERDSGRARKRILSMSALPPMGKLHKTSQVPVVALCAVLGAQQAVERAMHPTDNGRHLALIG